MDVSFLVPPPAGRRGGTVALLRWAAQLRRLGHRVRLERHRPGPPTDLVIGCARPECATHLAHLRDRRPGVKVVVAACRGEADPVALAAADRIVVPHAAALAALPAPFRSRARPIFPSAPRPGRRPEPAADRFEVCVLGGLADGADPLRPAAAARRLPAGSRIALLHVGPGGDERGRRLAREEEARNRRYRWLGPLRRAALREVLARARLVVLPPGADGAGAAVAEALAAGVPPLAARGGGAEAILGTAYPGLFAPWDADGLAELLARFETDPSFRALLAGWCDRLAPLADPARERAAWSALLGDLAGEPGPPDVRLSWIDLGVPPEELAKDVREGLGATPKRLPCRWLYDAEGSRLFEEICGLEEYYPTRTEDAILAASVDEVAAAMPPGTAVFELGSGSGAKTRRILAALLARQGRLLYAPLDISATALRESARALLPGLPGLEFRAVAGTYEDGLARLGELVPGPRLLLWLGSSIGNLEAAEAAAFLARIRLAMAPADRLLLGVDLLKDRAVLERAYDDARGVTARFNRNLLVRLNRELGADFDLEAFRHRAIWNEPLRRIEMHLVSVRPQRVRLAALDLAVDFDEGETVHTENSHKYAPEALEELTAHAGFRIERRFADERAWFASLLLRPAGPRVT